MRVSHRADDSKPITGAQDVQVREKCVKTLCTKRLSPCLCLGDVRSSGTSLFDGGATPHESESNCFAIASYMRPREKFKA